jgi:hypothetical protein
MMVSAAASAASGWRASNRVACASAVSIEPGLMEAGVTDGGDVREAGIGDLLLYCKNDSGDFAGAQSRWGNLSKKPLDSALCCRIIQYSTTVKKR